MPLYSYECHTCHDGWTEHRAIAQRDQPIQCPRCESWHTWKKPDAPNFKIEGFNAKNGYSK